MVNMYAMIFINYKFDIFFYVDKMPGINYVLIVLNVYQI